MGKIKDVMRTSAGILAADVAKASFSLAKDEKDSLPAKVALNVTGSIAAATSFHLLKEDVVEVRDIILGKK